MIVLPAAKVLHQFSAGTAPRAAAKASAASSNGCVWVACLVVDASSSSAQQAACLSRLCQSPQAVCQRDCLEGRQDQRDAGALAVAHQFARPRSCHQRVFGCPETASLCVPRLLPSALAARASVRVLGAGHVEQRSNGGCWAQGVCRRQSSNRGVRERSGGDFGGCVCDRCLEGQGKYATHQILVAYGAGDASK
jgi:hypothetical protein